MTGSGFWTGGESAHADTAPAPAWPLGNNRIHCSSEAKIHEALLVAAGGESSISKHPLPMKNPTTPDYHSNIMQERLMTETERIEGLVQKCRDAYFPESLIEMMTDFLAGRGTLAQLPEEWQQAQETERQCNPSPFSAFLNAGLIFSDFISRPHPAGEGLDALDRRLLDLCLATRQVRFFFQALWREKRIDEACEHLLSQGVEERQLLIWLLEAKQLSVDGYSGTITPLGYRMLAYIPHHADELPALVEGQLGHGYWLAPRFISLLLAAQPPFVDLAWQVVQQAQQHETHDYTVVGNCASMLLRADPERFTAFVREVASQIDPVNESSRLTALQALLEQDRAQHIDLAVQAVRAPLPSGRWDACRFQVFGLETAYQFDSVKYWPLLEEAALSRNGHLRTVALRLLSQASFDQARPVLQRGVASGSISDVALEALWALLKQPWDGQQDYVLALLAHRFKQVRECASAWLAEQGEVIIERVAPFVAHPRAETRLAAVQTFQRVGGVQVQALLATQLASEKVPRVKQAILEVVGVVEADTAPPE